MKSKHLLFLAVFILSALSSVAQLDKYKKKIQNLPNNVPSNTTSSITDSDIVNGLKEALSVGSKNASAALNKVDGYNKNPRVRIPFPEDCQKVATKLRELGFGKKVDEFELTLNRAAEDAAKEASPIFLNAIKAMSFADAKSILKGADTAATGYLRKTTYSQLFTSFKPHIQTALNNNKATYKWTELTTMYNKLPGVKKVDTDLPRYTTNKALHGLFLLVADEETKIRKDPAARVTDVLKKVFGS